MNFTKIALATALALTSTVALARTNGHQTLGNEGFGSVVAPSVGSYQTPVGATNTVPTWRNTGPAATLPQNNVVQNPMGRIK
jgi:hypothetical protein